MSHQADWRDQTEAATRQESCVRAVSVPQEPSDNPGDEHRDSAGQVEEAIARPAQVCGRGLRDHGRQKVRGHAHVESPDHDTRKHDAPVRCPPNFVFQRSMVSIETGRIKSAEDSEAGVHG
jgi:hypothetical protein